MRKRALAFLLKYLAYCVLKTLRVRLPPQPPTPCIVAIIHEESAVCSLCVLHATALVSHSRDGEAMSWILQKMGVQLIRGSTVHGGHRAIHALLRAIKLHPERRISTSVDGPRGPRRKFQPGVILLAKRCAVPLYICRCYYKGWRIRSSWDKHLFPKPFTTVHALFSGPFSIDRKVNVREYARQLEQELENMDTRASAQGYPLSRL